MTTDHAKALAALLWDMSTSYGILVTKEERQEKQSAAIKALGAYWADNPANAPFSL